MAQKLLRAKKRKVEPSPAGRARTPSAPQPVALVGTYWDRQLAWIRKNGVYNYPAKDGDEFSPEAFSAIRELWLYADAKGTRHAFAATFAGKMTRDEFLAAYPTYAKLSNGRARTPSAPHTHYYVFTVSPLDYASRLDNPVVIARTADFGPRSAKVKKAIERYRADGEFAPLAAYLPSDLAEVPRQQLRVCEAAVQMDFFSMIDPMSSALRQKDGEGKYKIASLFSGCGGLDLGFVGGFDFLGKNFARTGFEVVWANELNPAACRTYERNLGGHIMCGDIKDAIGSIPTGIDVVMGGFPCQDISINGKMLGIKGRRSCLYTYIVDAVKKIQPKVFVAENVGSLMLKQNEYSFKTILSDFKSLGYDITYHVYHAEQYGVPQTRERIIFVGTRSDMPKFVHPSPLSDVPITAGDALRDLESRPQSKEFSHVWSVAAPSGEQGSRRMVETRPGYTIRAECHGNIQFHYRLPRRISMREAARIQSFPDSFIFPCGIRETERQIGNAVPPVLAWHIAKSVKRLLDKADE